MKIRIVCKVKGHIGHIRVRLVVRTTLWRWLVELHEGGVGDAIEPHKGVSIDLLPNDPDATMGLHLQDHVRLNRRYRFVVGHHTSEECHRGNGEAEGGH